MDSVEEPFHIILYGVIGDCPALKLVLNMVGHTGYFCCFYCLVKGFHSQEARKRQYPYSPTTKQRTDVSFREDGGRAAETHRNVSGHLGISVLSGFMDVPFPFCILVDYAHVTLLRHFRDVLRSITSSLPPVSRKQIDISLRGQVFPHHFNRKLRGIEDLSFIKAVELRNLLIYAFLPNFIDYLTINQISFLSLLVLGVRLIYNDKIFGEKTSSVAHELIVTYYRDHRNYFDHHLNFVLHLHEHFARQYEYHGPLSSVNTLPFEDFIGYIAKNRNRTSFFYESLAYYYNIDVHIRNTEEEPTTINGMSFFSSV